jgi:hypothetical protein
MVSIRPLRSRPFVDILFVTAACAAALVLAGCGKSASIPEISVQHVPKEQPAPGSSTVASAGTPGASMPGAVPAATSAPSMDALPGMAEFVAATPAPKWTPPADWKLQPPDPARKGTWSVPAPAGAVNAQAAELSVNVFPGQLGTLLANVNRWRGQVGLASDLTEERLGENVKNITIDGRAAQLISVDGPDGKSLEGALIFMPSKTWSFRLFGSTATVTAQRPAFRAFLDSVKWQD